MTHSTKPDAWGVFDIYTNGAGERKLIEVFTSFPDADAFCTMNGEALVIPLYRSGHPAIHGLVHVLAHLQVKVAAEIAADGGLFSDKEYGQISKAMNSFFALPASTERKGDSHE